jgi:MFS family permease
VTLSSKRLWCDGLVQMFSLPIAMLNLAWGVFDIFAGMVADKFGLFRVLVAGVVFYSLGLVGTANAVDYDVCADIKLDEQTGVDTSFMVQQLQAGNPNFKNMFLEPIQEDWIQEHWVERVRRLSMMRIMARRTKAATVLV